MMWNFPPSVRLLACTTPVDFRKGFNGLPAIVRSRLHANPLDGHVYVFFNRRGDQVRLLYWDRNGYVLSGKRLERGRFKVPWRGKLVGSKWVLEAAELGLILEGIELSGAKRRARWSPARSITGISSLSP